MQKRTQKNVILLACIVFNLSSMALLFNYFVSKYPGNDYFPEHSVFMPFILFLIVIGLKIYFKEKSPQYNAGKELIFFFMIMSLIAYATNAIQLTPFPVIDHTIITFEKKLHIHLTHFMLWTNKHLVFKSFLIRVYNTLPYQMSLIPLFLIATQRHTTLINYYFLLLFSTLIGFIFYYFFPTIAPGSAINSPLFAPGQLATGIKFYEIHHYQTPSTIDGGLIALPSFHVIWGMLCVYLVKDWPVFFFSLMFMNFFLILSCVLLGWHYPTDVVAGLLVVGFSFVVLQWSHKKVPFKN